MYAMGYDTDLLSKALSGIKGIPGRFERVVKGKDFHVFVDYAHTPDALAHLLEAANALKRGRIITVFGCGGDRDRGKRPKMGRVVEENSDITIVTSDNPRSEDPVAIIDDIQTGLRGTDHVVIPDRREAIYRAVELAAENDIVLIAGKGHEDYQILGDETIHFDDREVARDAINDLK
jgi:UDP-N-acetylmuramyl-tripeptide synthetase